MRTARARRAITMLRAPAAHQFDRAGAVGEADAPRRFQLTIGVADTDAFARS